MSAETQRCAAAGGREARKGASAESVRPLRQQRPARFQCPRCRRTNDYSIRWLRRTKKAQVPGGADARDRAMFEKVKDHLVRVDDDVTCKTCGKRFEIPSHRALVFLEELEGLPQEDYDE